MDLKIRPRRLRQKEAVRNMVAETTVRPEHLIYPIFICEAETHREEIRTMPGQFRLGRKEAIELVRAAQDLGVNAFALFPVVTLRDKDERGSSALNADHFSIRFVAELRAACPNAILISDLALDPFTDHGHDGLVSPTGEVLNDETAEVLAQMAVLHARAGANWVAPSDMMDGRVGLIRKALDENGHSNTAILAYTAKYASSFYGPFRDALDSAPKAGDKKTYQMDPRNRREAVREALLDIEEGADIIMVKPGLPYLDIISDLKEMSPVPVAAYNVSGEYAMIKFAAAAGAINETAAMMESLTAFRRAGADMILTYWALDFARQARR